MGINMSNSEASTIVSPPSRLSIRCNTVLCKKLHSDGLGTGPGSSPGTFCATGKKDPPRGNKNGFRRSAHGEAVAKEFCDVMLQDSG